MSTRYSKNERDGTSIPLGYEGSNVAETIDIPSNTLEDVDKSVFDLFDKQLPFQYDRSGTMTRVPVIFASGERFAVLRRKKPLRDKTGALILPILSIMRTSIAQTNAIGNGISELQTQIIKKKLSKEDNSYQRLLNSRKENNSLDLAINPFGADSLNRLKSERRDHTTNQQGMQPILGKNIYEIWEIPPVKFFTATYEITFWTQYTQQMNDMLMAMMSLYQNNSQRTLRLETPKGYWFVGYVGEQMSNGDNFDGFLDDERIIKYSFEMTVPSYMISAEFPGSLKAIRRFLSAPEMSFASWYHEPIEVKNSDMGIQSGNPNHYVFEDLRSNHDMPPAQSIALNRRSTHVIDTVWPLKSKDRSLNNYVAIKSYAANRQGETVYRGIGVTPIKNNIEE
jgi:hypothetical protein